MVKRSWCLPLLFVVPTACRPDLNVTVSIVTGPQVLGVRSDPAEVAPKGAVTLTALVADAQGPISSAPIQWAFCNARKPLAELGPVNALCVQSSGDWFSTIGVGVQAKGTIPSVACRQFGPEVPVPQANQPAGRPVDPDPTGGYYQPVRLLLPTSAGDLVAIAEPRLSCGVAGAAPAQAVDFSARYRANENPKIQALAAIGGAVLTSDDQGAPNPVNSGEKLALRVSWASCPVVDACGDGVCGPDEAVASCPTDCTMPKGCSGAERYVNFDLASRTLVDRREGIHVAWFATAGSFDLDRTGRDGSDSTASSDNAWKAPVQAGPVHLWVVLHDDRGGAGWAGYALDVR
jgi:hypothetical protein